MDYKNLPFFLDGVLREMFGSYTVLWIIDIALCVFASVMSFGIKEEKATCYE